MSCTYLRLKGELVKVENADTYTITNASRDNTGEYKCSLIDDPTMEASKDISIQCKRPKHKQEVETLYHRPASMSLFLLFSLMILFTSYLFSIFCSFLQT